MSADEPLPDDPSTPDYDKLREEITRQQEQQTKGVGADAPTQPLKRIDPDQLEELRRQFDAQRKAREAAGDSDDDTQSNPS